MSKKAAKKAAQVSEPSAPKAAPAKKDSKILTRSELAKLSREEKEAFRKAGGTMIEDAAAK